MVKRWGKSPPRTGQPGRHGKPHPEQCRIGASRGKVWPMPSGGQRPPQGRFSPEARVGSLTVAVTRTAEEWSSRGGNSLDRIRLTGHPRNFRAGQGGAAPFTRGAGLGLSIWAKVKGQGALSFFPCPEGLGERRTVLAPGGAIREVTRGLRGKLANKMVRRLVWLLTLPRPQVKGGLQEISRGRCVSPF